MKKNQLSIYNRTVNSFHPPVEAIKRMNNNWLWTIRYPTLKIISPPQE